MRLRPGAGVGPVDSRHEVPDELDARPARIPLLARRRDGATPSRRPARPGDVLDRRGRPRRRGRSASRSRSRFFAVGTVVPWARAGVGAVATQASANTSFGPNGLELMGRGLSAEEALKVLLRGDEGRDRRQVGLVSASGDSATYSGPGCNSWAGGRRGPNYAVQGNILTGEAVRRRDGNVLPLDAGKPLAERLLAALAAGDIRAGAATAGGGSRRRSSVLPREGGLQRLHRPRRRASASTTTPDPFRELARLVGMGVVNDLWNQGWTAFMEKRFADGAEGAGGGDDPRRGAAGDAPRGRLRPRRHPAGRGEPLRGDRGGAAPRAEAEPKARRAGEIRSGPRGDPGGAPWAAAGSRRKETPWRRSP